MTDKRLEKKFEIKGGKVFFKNGPAIWLSTLLDGETSAAELAATYGIGASSIRGLRRMAREHIAATPTHPRLTEGALTISAGS